jgi:hypothetical protein
MFDGRARKSEVKHNIGNRSVLIRRYLVSAGTCLALGFLCVAIGSHLQLTRWNPAYRLVPVDQVSLYFFPLAAPAFSWLAHTAGRLDGSLVVGSFFAWAWSAGRVLYWRWIAADLSLDPGADEFRRLTTERSFPSLLVGSIGLCALVLLALGTYRSLRPDQDFA